MRLAYLYSRYPVLSQTFCDTEMLALERLGFRFLIGSIHPPLTTIRHAHSTQLLAPVHYAPPPLIVRLFEEKTRKEKLWPESLIARHDQKYGLAAKAPLRARNAAYFADLFTRNKIDHVHVHFANRAAHTALFLKEIANLPFSITAHGQDFMADLGSQDLLREICEAAKFIAVETDYSRSLMTQLCPTASEKIQRVYNGMNLVNFLQGAPSLPATLPVRILSIGRLVPFKGFEYLIDACGQLQHRGVSFRCEIVGDGPLREGLQKKIDDSKLGAMITLTGALPQEDVIERLRHCDVFALASIIDDRGASDIFPTVILEAMASARPVVSTMLAGIPEAVVNQETGFLVPAGKSAPLAEALETLCRDDKLRARLGANGRTRVEKHFQVETTVQPLIKLFKAHGAAKESSDLPSASPTKIAYLIDCWPDPHLPAIETELLAVHQRNPAIRAIVCEFAHDCRLAAKAKKLALQLEFLPDAMAIEAEWQANRTLVLALEEERANESVRIPADLFLRQARFAIALRRLLRDVSHVHATNSRALICGVLLKKLLPITLSASIENKPDLSRDVLENALQHAVGGRIADRKLSQNLSESFVPDPTEGRNLRRGLDWITGSGRIDLTRRAGFWQEWSDLLDQWNSRAKSNNR